MDKDLQEFIADYRKKVAIWEELLDVESRKREDMIIAHGDNGNEPDNLREELDEYCISSGLREKQRVALKELKEAERKLFAWHLEHVKDPTELDELKRLARDYADRISWLRQFLEEKEDAKA